MNNLPKVSVIIVNFNGRDYIRDCLDSVLQQNYPTFEVIVVDNASSDESANIIAAEFSPICLIRAEQNNGFGSGNNLGAVCATGQYLAFLNPDTTVDPDWLRELVTALESDAQAGLATPQILLKSTPDRINTCGNEVHFTGIPALRGWMLPANALPQLEEVCSVSGAAFLIRKSVFDQIGGFDGSFFLYAEDNDLSWRARIAGYRCLYVPTAVIYHRYVPRFGPDKFFYLERNRYRVLFKNLQWRTLLILIPALFLSDLVTWGYALTQGRKHVRAKLRVYGWFAKHWRTDLVARRKLQRKIPDRVLLSQCSYRLAYDLAHKGHLAPRIGSRIFDPLFCFWYHFCLAVIWW